MPLTLPSDLSQPHTPSPPTPTPTPHLHVQPEVQLAVADLAVEFKAVVLAAHDASLALSLVQLTRLGAAPSLLHHLQAQGRQGGQGVRPGGKERD